MTISDLVTWGATIKRLVDIGSPEALKALEDLLVSTDGDQARKSGALLALAKIGTKESVDAIGRWERWRITNSENPPKFKFGKMEAPIFHMGAVDVRPFAQSQDDVGTTWAVFNWMIFPTKEPYALWITKSTGADSWSEPIYIHDEIFDGPVPSEGDKGSFKKTTMFFRFGQPVLKSEMVFYPQKYATDTDGDGLTDEVEYRYQTDYKIADTDKDGIDDKKDSNPLTPKQAINGDLEQIRQTAFAFMFNTSNSQMAILAINDSKKKTGVALQEYYGYYGKILKRSEVEPGWENLTDIKVKMESTTSASVTVEEYWGNLAGSFTNLKLRKLFGKWVVVESLGGGVA